MVNGEESEDMDGIVLDPNLLAFVRAEEDALVEREVTLLTAGGRRLASRIIARIVEIEAEWGAEVAEAVVEGVIEILRGGRRVLS